jgi:predicted RNase H-like HicB family nuclease
MLYRLNLEEMEGRWIAYVASLPGCFASADTFSAALALAPQAIADYLAWLHGHGEAIAPHELATEMGELHRAWNSGPDYEVNAFFATDRAPLTSSEITRALRLLAWTRVDLLAAIEGISADDLVHEVEPGWSIRRILQHIGGSEWWYLDRLGLAFPKAEVPEDPFVRLERVRAHFRSVLPSLAGVDKLAAPEMELWSPRKMLRRALWHERDHTAHIRQFRRRLASVTPPHSPAPEVSR